MMPGKGGVKVPVITTLDSRALDVLKRKLGTAKTEVNGFRKAGERLNKALSGFGILAAGGAFTELARKGSDGAKAMALTDRIIQNVGLSSSVSAAKVEALSEAISNNTGQSKLQVQQAANVFLGFKNLVPAGKDAQGQIEALTKTSVDLAAKLGSDAPSAAKVLARALANPANASKSLMKAGIGMTDASKAQVKQLVKEGKIQQARSIIFNQIEQSVKDLASKTATPFEKFQAQLQNIEEKIGLKLLPVFAKLMPVILPLIDVISNLALTILNGLSPVLDPLLTVLKDIAGVVKRHEKLFSDLALAIGAAYLAYKAVTGASMLYKVVMQNYALYTYTAAAATEDMTFAQYLQARATTAVTGATKGLSAAMKANPIGFIIIGVTLLVAGFKLLYDHCKPFRDFLAKAMPVLGKVFGGVVAFILHSVALLIRGFKGYLSFWFGFADKVLAVANFAFGWLPGLGDKIKAARAGFKEFGAKVGEALSTAADKVDSFADTVDKKIKAGAVHMAANIRKHGQKTKKAAKESGQEAGIAFNKGLNDGLTTPSKVKSPVRTTAATTVGGGNQSFTVAGQRGDTYLQVTINGSVMQQKDVVRAIRDELLVLARRQGANVQLGV